MRVNRIVPLVVLLLGLGSPGIASAMGLLIPNDESLSPLAIESHRVSIEVTDNLATTHIDEVFRNSSGTQLEATFVFPLPADATVSDFALYINGERVQGEVLESTQARQIYNNIVRRVRDPGLVEYVDGRIFQASIFPVPANGTQRVELEFAQVLEREGELLRLSYPLRTGQTSSTTLLDFTLATEIHSSVPLRTVYSPTHDVEVVRHDERWATVGLELANADLERDFELYLSTDEQEVGMTLFAFDSDGATGEDGYFVSVITPRLETDEEIVAKDVTFVVDTSGSMSAEKIAQAQATLRYCLSQLGPQDRFNIVRFSTTARPLFDQLTAVSEDALSRAETFIGEMRAAGGTAIQQALETALGQSTTPSQPHFIIFLTDGLPTVGETNVETLLTQVTTQNTAGARIFSFGVGYDVDTTLLDRLAQQNGGVSDYVRPDEDIELAVSNLYNRISHPILNDVTIDFGTADVYDVFPTEIPDLFAGQQAVIAGRYRNTSTSQVSLAGRTADQTRSYSFAQSFGDAGNSFASTEHDFIPQLWATRKIGFLVDQVRMNGENPELRDEIIALGTRYGLVTPYTSYLAVDDSEFQPQPDDNWDMPTEPTLDPGPPLSMNLERSGFDSGWGEEGRERSRDEADHDEIQGESPPTVAAPTPAPDLSMPVGQSAVDVSEEARRLQEVAINDRNMPVQQVGSFNLNLDDDGVWRDVRVSENQGAQRVLINYLSEAYFRLLEINSTVGDVMALGEHVELVVNGVVVEIVADSGVEALDADTEMMLAE